MTFDIERVVVRTATPSDAEACFVAHRESTLVAYAHIFPRDEYPFPDDAMRARWQGECAAGTVLVAVLEDQTIGTAGVDGSELVSFFVLPEYWGSGAADKLYQAIVDQARERLTHKMTLWTLTENRRARSFYEKHGWKVTGETTQSAFPPYPELVQYVVDVSRQ